MKIFSSLAAVMALWLAVSFSMWLAYRIFRNRDGSKQRKLASAATALIDEGAAIFAGLRFRASLRVNAQGNYASDTPEEALRNDVRVLLNGIEAQSPYFERVNILKKKIQNTFGVPDFQALSEILQIRRDFWAASEIFLIDGIRELGPELADTSSFETFQEEARRLLFGDMAALAGNPGEDPVKLRLSIAKEDALAFQAGVENAISERLEKSRFPTPAEILSGPLGLVRGVFQGLREVRYLLADAVIAARKILRAMSSKGLRGAAEELRRARSEMPVQFATAFERAGGLARQGGQGLKRHYEFVIEAQELRARYAELLAGAPNLSEKGRQFLTRLELEKRAEKFRDTSGNLMDAARQGLVAGIAHLIAALQYVQAMVTPAGHKQLAPLAAPPSAFTPGPADAPAVPMRVLLLPSSAYSGGNYGAAAERPRRRPKVPISDPRPKPSPDDVIAGLAPDPGRSFRELPGRADVLDEERPAMPRVSKTRKPAKPKVSYAEGLKKMSFKDLLSNSGGNLDEDHVVGPGSEGFPHSSARSKGRSSGGTSLPDDPFADLAALGRDLGQSGSRGHGPLKGASLLNRLASLEDDAGAKQAGTAESARQQKSKTGWRLFGSKRG